MIRRVMNKTDPKVVPYSFEQVSDFNYLGVTTSTVKKNIHNQMKLTVKCCK